METNVKAVELKELWRRCKEEGDERARERLVVAYSPPGDPRVVARLGMFISAVRDGYNGDWRLLEATLEP